MRIPDERQDQIGVRIFALAGCLFAASALIVASRWRAQPVAQPPPVERAVLPPAAVAAKKPSTVEIPSPAAVETAKPSAAAEAVVVERPAKKRRATVHNGKRSSSEMPTKWDPEAITPP